MMDIIISILIAILAGFVILVLMVIMGVLIKPHLRIPNRTVSIPPDYLPDQVGLSATFKRFLQARYGNEMPMPQSVIAWGTGKMVSSRLPLIGPLWLPLNWTIDLLPGKAFVLEGRFFWFRRLLFIGTDQYINGKGHFVMSDSIIANDNLSASELTLLWIYTILLAPTSLVNMPCITITDIDEHQFLISIEAQDGKTRHFTLTLKPDSGALTHLFTQRTATKSGLDLDFHVRFQDSTEVAAGKNLPQQINFAWEDVPYLKLELAGAAFNRNIQAILDEADLSTNKEDLKKTAPSLDSAADL